MSLLQLSNIGKLLLIILSAASFVPQIRDILRLGSWAGLSLISVLFNLIVATEQFTLGLQCIVIMHDAHDNVIAYYPRMMGDWLNLCQWGVVWLGHVVLFICCLSFPPGGSLQKTAPVITYIAFLLISLLFVVFETFLPPENLGSSVDTDGRWIFTLFSGFHIFYIDPTVTGLGLLAILAQAWEMWSRSSVGALSTTALWSQAVMFTLLGLAWMARLQMPEECWRGSLMGDLKRWYHLVGWASVDCFVFAFGQAVLFVIATSVDKMGS